jgi:hypothetical protein
MLADAGENWYSGQIAFVASESEQRLTTMTRQRRQLALWLLVLCLAGEPASAITIQLDYTYDTNNFFAPGSQARASLTAAAGFFSNILNDTFSAITVPDPYPSTYPGSDGVVSWIWTRNFNHPSTNNPVVVTHQTPGLTLAADSYVVYAGARNLSGNTLGIGGPGGYSRGNMLTGSDQFTPSDILQMNQITEDFFDAVDTRGESSGFARWGGTIAFDTTPASPWHFNHTTSPSGSVSDFYSVAIHELAHALGFGGSSEWQALVSASSFFGSNANAEYGGPVPLATGLSHWADGTDSIVYGGATPQETAMDPTLTTGTRKLLTKLDAAAMKDIGWTVIAPPGVDGDYNNNGIVDAADYVIWRKIIGTTTGYNTWRTNFGNTSGSGGGGVVGVGAVPEATSAVLAILGLLGAQFARGRRRG